MKKFLKSLLLFLAMTTIFTTTAYAVKYRFRFEVFANSFPATSGIGTKVDTANYGAVTPTSGLNGNYHVTFRIRDLGGYYATEYVDIAYNDVTGNMTYYPGKSITNGNYILYSSLDSGQSVSSAQVTGRWEP